MHRSVTACLVASILLQPVAAGAETPDEAGAKKLAEAVKTYGPDGLSKPGMLRVSPDGGGYRMVIDTLRLVADAVAPIAVREATPLAFRLNWQTDGKWAFDAPGPFNLTMEYVAANRTGRLALTTASKTVKGVFDPEVIFPRQAELAFTDAMLNVRDSGTSLRVGIKDYRLTSGATDLAGGHSDIDAIFSAQDFTATHGVFPQPEFKLSAARIDGTYRLGKLDLAGLADMLRFWQVTAADRNVETLTEAEREELRKLLVRHMPVVDAVGGSLVASDVAMSEAGRRFTLGKLDYLTRWEGLGGNAALVVGARITDAGIAPGVWPKPLEAILPTEAALNVRATGFDMAGVWKDSALLRTAKEQALLPRYHFSQILVPEGRIALDVTDSFARSSFYDVTLSGRAHLVRDNSRLVSGLLTVTAKDLDATVKYLQENAKTVPVFGRFAFMTLMMKGLGRVGPDGATVWEIRLDDAGKITVNGQPLPG